VAYLEGLLQQPSGVPISVSDVIAPPVSDGSKRNKQKGKLKIAK